MRKKSFNILLKLFFIVLILVFSFLFCYVILIEKAQKFCPDTKQFCQINSSNLAIQKYTFANYLYQESFVQEQIGLLYFQQEKYDLSYEYITKAIKLKNKFPLYEKIKSVITSGVFQPADWDIKQILLYFILGDLSTKLGNYTQCVEDFSKMIEVATQHGRTSFQKDKRGYCYYKLGMYQNAYNDCVDEKQWLNDKIKELPENKLKSAYIKRLNRVEKLITEINSAQRIVK